MLTIEEIRKIKYPSELFSEDIETMKKQYVELMKIYHPDLNEQKQEYIEVTEKINKLYKEAESNIEKGIWNKPGMIKLRKSDGKYYMMKFRISHNFELGKMYIGNEIVLYLFNEENEKFALNALKQIKNLKYANDDMEKEFSKYMPRIITSFRTVTGKIGIVFEKEEDLILLRDLLTYYKGKVSVNTASWVLSNLYNISCFLHYNELTHNGITIDSYFVSTSRRYGVLIGGWWYSVREGERLLSVAKSIEHLMPYEMKISNKANSLLDLESIRLLGRRLLGDESGDLLSVDGDVPSTLNSWLKAKAGSNPFQEYSTWSNVVNSIGELKVKRKIIDKDELYKKIGGR